MNDTYTFIVIAVYLGTVAVVYYTLYKRFTDTLADLETEYRLNYARMCTTFIETMQTVSRALDTDEPEQTKLSEGQANK